MSVKAHSGLAMTTTLVVQKITNVLVGQSIFLRQSRNNAVAFVGTILRSNVTDFLVCQFRALMCLAAIRVPQTIFSSMLRVFFRSQPFQICSRIVNLNTVPMVDFMLRRRWRAEKSNGNKTVYATRECFPVLAKHDLQIASTVEMRFQRPSRLIPSATIACRRIASYLALIRNAVKQLKSSNWGPHKLIISYRLLPVYTFILLLIPLAVYAATKTFTIPVGTTIYGPISLNSAHRFADVSIDRSLWTDPSRVMQIVIEISTNGGPWVWQCAATSRGGGGPTTRTFLPCELPTGSNRQVRAVVTVEGGNVTLSIAPSVGVRE